MKTSFSRLVLLSLLLETLPLSVHTGEGFDSASLRNAGISAAAIGQLRDLGLDREEVKQAVAAKRAGMAEQNLVQLCRIYRSKRQRFTNGKAVVALRTVGTRDETILNLAQRDLLNGWVPDAVAMRKAGFTDGGILQLADLRFQEKKAVPSGQTLARLKFTGLSEEAIITLVKKGLQASDVETIERLRREGTDEKEIIRKFKAGP